MEEDYWISFSSFNIVGRLAINFDYLTCSRFFRPPGKRLAVPGNRGCHFKPPWSVNNQPNEKRSICAVSKIAFSNQSSRRRINIVDQNWETRVLYPGGLRHSTDRLNSQTQPNPIYSIDGSVKACQRKIHYRVRALFQANSGVRLSVSAG